MTNRGFQIVLLFLIVFGFTNCKKPQTDILYNKKYIDEIKKTRKEMGFFISSNFIPGGSIAVIKNGELIYSEGMGLASKDLNVNVTRKTKFRIGTLSEIFTSVIYFKMQEEGLLNADSTVQHYYPAFPKKTSPVKLQHLINHTSGIRQPNNKEQSWRGLNVSLEKGIDNFKNDELNSQSGLYENPSAFNYNLLGVVMEKATKQRFRDLLANYLCDTLHLNNTVTDNALLPVDGRTDYFDHSIISQVINATSIDLRHSAPSSGILSNAEDLVLLGNALLSSDYFTTETKKKFFEKVILDNGIEPDKANTWVALRDKDGNLVYGKDGSVKGGSASMLIFPKDELIIACTTNLTGATNNFPIFKIADFFLPAEEENKAINPAE